MSSHKRLGKDLVPQLMNNMNVRFSSWMNVRMPEMLWATLLVSTLPREDALKFFRIFAENFSALSEEKRPKDLFISDLASIDYIELERVIRVAIDGVPNASYALRPLLLFPNIPGRAVWESVLSAPDENGPMQIVEAVSKVLNHQSEEATDCRWIRVVYTMLCGKLMFPESLADLAREILEYPNWGQMEKVRPSVRAAEITLSQVREHGGLPNEETEWTKHFWEVGFQATPCLVGERVHQNEEIDVNIFQDEIFRLRTEVSEAFIDTQTTSAIDTRHDGAFGLILYAIDICSEISQPKIHNGTLGRIGLRTVVEIFITLSYLIKLDDPKKWEAYRNYGAGQAKLAFLKLLDVESLPDFVDMEALEDLANEDLWQEFLTIKIGNWDAGNLRKMSEAADEKNIYDSFYDWTSGYIHGQWGVVRDTTMTNCVNPLHRLHRVPKQYQDYRASVIGDLRVLLANMVNKLKVIYPY
ncbi:hypothetical protein FNU79_00540 [Deinococcus detaillensis]|uniref:Uncharacterized protein n=1 Tax=Deinococcus detaillensis TaxID=2592048 RepID=A0A553V5N9_9DEIO|nr:hypothetical protein FNU79_00540 [Deinococcus detaillensis]